MMAAHGASLYIDEVIRFIMDILGDGVESNNENMFREEGNEQFDPANVSGSDSDYLEENVVEVSEPSTTKGVIVEYNCDVVVVVVVVRCGSGGSGGAMW